MLTDHHPGASLTVPADVTADLTGHSGATVTLTVTNSGTESLAVVPHVADITARARLHPAASWITAIEPARLRLAPGETGHVVLTVRVPAGASGTHYVNVVYAAGPIGHGPVRLAAGVGGTLRLTHPGTLAAARPPAAPTHHGTGAPVGLIAVDAVAVLAIAGAALFVWLRHRYHGAHR